MDHGAEREFEVEHFNRDLPLPKYFEYANLRLACDVCNSYKGPIPVINPNDPQQYLIDCTVENEFPTHIVERPDGSWEAKTLAGGYHIDNLGLWNDVHIRRRLYRNEILKHIAELESPVQFRQNLGALAGAVQETLEFLKTSLKNQIPLPTDQGLQYF